MKLNDFMQKLHAAGFEIDVIDSQLPLWRVALTTPEEVERDEGGTCFNGIPIWTGYRWDVCIQTTTPAVHSSEWYRHFHAELAQAVWDEDADGRKVTPKNLGDDK
jgi:hypothetical protein